MIYLSNDEIMARIGCYNNAGAEPVPLWDATWEDGQDKASGINKCPMPKRQVDVRQIKSARWITQDSYLYI